MKLLPSVNQRIKDVIEKEFGGNVTAFAKKLGYDSSQKINRLFKIDPRSGEYPVPSSSILSDISNIFDMSIDFLQTGKSVKNASSIIVGEYEAEYKSRNELKMIPETSFELSAGGTLILTEDKVVNYWYLPDCKDCEAIVPMRGESMMPKYPPGSKLALKKYGMANPLSIPFGQEFAVIVEDKATGYYNGHIKILRRHPDKELSKKYWIARSINSNFDDFEIEIEQVRSLWIVKQYSVNNILL